MQVSPNLPEFSYGQANSKKPISIRHVPPIPNLINDVFISSIVPYLSVKELSLLMQVCRAFHYLLNTECPKDLIEYRFHHIKGLFKYNRQKISPSYGSLILDCINHIKNCKYSALLLNLLGGAGNILSLPIIDLSGKGSYYRKLEDFSISPMFSELPPIFRIRFTTSKQIESERIIIKYSLFIPKRRAKQVDRVWHDFFDLHLSEDAKFNKTEWIIYDMRLHTWPKKFRSLKNSSKSLKKVALSEKSLLTKLADPKLKAFMNRNIINMNESTNLAVIGHLNKSDFSKLIEASQSPVKKHSSPVVYRHSNSPKPIER